jgi:hypothetical protein
LAPQPAIVGYNFEVPSADRPFPSKVSSFGSQLLEVLSMRLGVALLVGLFAAVSTSHLDAAQFRTHLNGRAVVVHTNPIPVMVHRILPPDKGRHVTVREYQAGHTRRANVRGR